MTQQELETSREKSSLFLRRLHESLSKNKLCNEVIAKAVIERLEIRQDGDLVVATIRDFIYEGFVRQPGVYAEMKELTREVFGSGIEFLIVSGNATSAPRKRSRKANESKAVVDPLFESQGNPATQGAPADTSVAGFLSVRGATAAGRALPVPRAEALPPSGRAGAIANSHAGARSQSTPSQRTGGSNTANLLAQALSAASEGHTDRMRSSPAGRDVPPRAAKRAAADESPASLPKSSHTQAAAQDPATAPLGAQASAPALPESTPKPEGPLDSPTAAQAAAQDLGKMKKSRLAALGNINKMSMPAPASASLSTAVDYEPRASGGTERPLDPEFTFQSFVQGSTNEMASLACLNASRDPGNVSNPVFIYGSTGLGKTHLLHAVGNEIRSNHPDWHVRYVTSEDLISDLTRAVRFNKQHELRSKYRQVDVLLVDDIQFIEGKDGTQLEFFHIFNDLYQNKKQIVITSDQYPKSIPNIEERLKSRFLQGLIASIEPPTFEDRVGIIEVKAESFGLALKRDHIEYIATHVKSNVREITGVLKTLLVNQSIKGEPPTLEAIQREVRKDVRIPSQGVDIFSIQKSVAEHFGVKLQELRGTSRKENFVTPRHVAMYLAREMLDMTTTEIADAFNRRDHTTVLNAVRRISELMAQDASTLATVKELRRKLEHAAH
jgi:chromosomal replication initiator protein